MSNRLLPHAVTYYKRKTDGEGYERHVLCPVRVIEEVQECDGIVLHHADLYILRDELLNEMPEPQIGDSFLRGSCEADTPPDNAYRVTHMLPKLDYNVLKLVHLEGLAAGGVTDGL